MLSLIILLGRVLNYYNNLDDSKKEKVIYIIFGFFTTVVNISSYNILRLFLNNYIICSFISWVLAVIFAYFMNRKYVFKSKEKNILKELSSFILVRIISLLAELAIMFVFVEFFKIDDRIAKIVVQISSIILNYIFSKIYVFKDRKDIITS